MMTDANLGKFKKQIDDFVESLDIKPEERQQKEDEMKACSTEQLLEILSKASGQPDPKQS